MNRKDYTVEGNYLFLYLKLNNKDFSTQFAYLDKSINFAQCIAIYSLVLPFTSLIGLYST